MPVRHLDPPWGAVLGIVAAELLDRLDDLVGSGHRRPTMQWWVSNLNQECHRQGISNAQIMWNLDEQRLVGFDGINTGVVGLEQGAKAGDAFGPCEVTQFFKVL